MKKIISLVLALMLALSLFAMPAFASEYVGTVYKTDTMCYINNVPIKCYNMHTDDGSYVFIQVEDLEDYGFDIKWNAYNESLRILKDDRKAFSYSFPAYKTLVKEYYDEWFDMYTTNVSTYIGNYGYEIECLAGLPGCTYINVENLSAFGSVTWSDEDNAMYVDTYRYGGFYYPHRINDNPHDVDWYVHHKEAYNGYPDDNHYYEFTHFVDKENALAFDFGYYSEDSYGNLTSASACPGTFYADIYDTEGRKVYTKSDYFYTSEARVHGNYKIGEAKAPWTYRLAIPSGALTPGASYMAELTFWCDYCDEGYSQKYYFDMPYYGYYSSQFLNDHSNWTWNSFEVY